VAFQEYVIKHDGFAAPEPVKKWEEAYGYAVRTFEVAGVELEMGLKLCQVFTQAGLRAPQFHMDVHLLGPSDRDQSGGSYRAEPSSHGGEVWCRHRGGRRPRKPGGSASRRVCCEECHFELGAHSRRLDSVGWRTGVSIKVYGTRGVPVADSAARYHFNTLFPTGVDLYLGRWSRRGRARRPYFDWALRYLSGGRRSGRC
jgi:hypothetical protein